MATHQENPPAGRPYLLPVSLSLPGIDHITVAAFGLPLLLYLLTLAPTIYNLDSAELTTAAATGGIVRATGYPLYLLLGRIWSWLPLGDVGFRLNLMSAVSGALTLALAEQILRRMKVEPWARFGALGLLATAPFFWSLSLIAEVYTLHTALMAGVLLLLLRWADDPTPGRVAFVVFLGALSLGNHAATVLLVPACLWYVLTVAPRSVLKPRTVLLSAGAVALGLSVYLVLPLRFSADPAFNYAGTYDAMGAFTPVDLHTPAGMWWLVSGQAFADQMLGYTPAELWQEVGNFSTQLWLSFFAIGIGPGVLGLVTMWRRDWRLGGMLTLAFLVNAGFYINYRVVDKNTMFLPAYLIWALWLGVGYQVLLAWLRQIRPADTRPWLAWAVRAVMAGAVVLALAVNWSRVDLSDDWSARARGEAILQQVEEDALILGWWDTVPVVEYLQLVEGQRPDVETINRFLISGDDMMALIRREVASRPVYINNPPGALLKTMVAEPVGPVYRLRLR